MHELNAELRKIIAEIGGPSSDFDSGADLYQDLKLNSFQAAELLTTIEDRYQVSIPDERYLNARSLADLTEMTRSLIDQK